MSRFVRPEAHARARELGLELGSPPTHWKSKAPIIVVNEQPWQKPTGSVSITLVMERDLLLADLNDLNDWLNPDILEVTITDDGDQYEERCEPSVVRLTFIESDALEATGIFLSEEEGELIKQADRKAEKAEQRQSLIEKARQAGLKPEDLA